MTEESVRLDGIYVPSEDIVAREVAGELVIIPLTSGIGDMEDDLFSLNETGRAVWNRLDGKNSLRKVTADISNEFDAPADRIETGVLGVVQEMFQRGIVVEAASA